MGLTTQELVERLRGTYRVPITDGLGPAGGEEPGNADFFVRTFPTSPLAKAAADRLSELERENKRLRELLADALGMASQHRVAALDAEHGVRGDRTRPASDADWRAFQDTIRAALNHQQKGEHKP